MKTYEELEILNQKHLDFITAYLKNVLTDSHFGSLEKLYNVGSIINVEGVNGIVVGYCGVGYEYVLFQDDKGKDGYYVSGIPDKTVQDPKDIDFLEVAELVLKMNDYLIKNQFRLSTPYQKECYKYWLQTGKYLFNEVDQEKKSKKNHLQNQVDKISKELEKLKEELSSLNL